MTNHNDRITRRTAIERTAAVVAATSVGTIVRGVEPTVPRGNTVVHLAIRFDNTHPASDQPVDVRICQFWVPRNVVVELRRFEIHPQLGWDWPAPYSGLELSRDEAIGIWLSGHRTGTSVDARGYVGFACPNGYVTYETWEAKIRREAADQLVFCSGGPGTLSC